MKKIIFALFIIIFTSCSLGSLLIGKLDYYLTVKTSSRLGLYVKQENELRKDIQILLEDIKPEVQVILKQLNLIKNNTDNLKSTLNNELIDEFNKNYLKIMEKVFKTLSKYLAILTEKQIEQLVTSIDKQIKTREKKLHKKKQYENFIERFEEFIGKLTPEQKLIIKKEKESFFLFQQMRLVQQKQQNSALKEAFKLPENQRQNAMENLFQFSGTNIKETMSSEAYSKINLSVLEVLNRLNKEQKQFLMEKCDFFIDLIESFLDHKYTN